MGSPTGETRIQDSAVTFDSGDTIVIAVECTVCSIKSRINFGLVSWDVSLGNYRLANNARFLRQIYAI